MGEAFLRARAHAPHMSTCRFIALWAARDTHAHAQGGHAYGRAGRRVVNENDSGGQILLKMVQKFADAFDQAQDRDCATVDRLRDIVSVLEEDNKLSKDDQGTLSDTAKEALELALRLEGGPKSKPKH